MKLGRVVVWHDLNRSHNWIVSLEDEATVVEHEFVRTTEDGALQAAKTLGAAIGRPVFKAESDGTLKLIRP